jgi:hypothetical protein
MAQKDRTMPISNVTELRYRSGCADGGVHVCHFPSRGLAIAECSLFDNPDLGLDCGPHHVVEQYMAVNRV